MATLINGVSYSYNNIRIAILGLQPKGVSSISYSTSRESAHFYGAGDLPVALGYGKKTFEASMEIQFEELQNIRTAARSAGLSGDITKIAPFDIVISYGEIGQPITTHTLKKCVFLNDGVEAGSDDTTLIYSVSILPADIEY